MDELLDALAPDEDGPEEYLDVAISEYSSAYDLVGPDLARSKIIRIHIMALWIPTDVALVDISAWQKRIEAAWANPVEQATIISALYHGWVVGKYSAPPWMKEDLLRGIKTIERLLTGTSKSRFRPALRPQTSVDDYSVWVWTDNRKQSDYPTAIGSAMLASEEIGIWGEIGISHTRCTVLEH